MTHEDQAQVAVGRPLPFSVYGADGTLLLAAGRLVSSEFVRDGLLRSGKLRGEAAHDAGPALTTAPMTATSDAIAALQADYQHTHARAPVGFRMERDHRVQTSRVIGVSEDGHGLIMSWPAPADENPVSLAESEEWTFRALYAIAAVRFHGTVEKVVTTPFAYFYVSRLKDIDRRNVRQWPRAPTCLWATRATEPPRIIVDISVGGARIGVDTRSHLEVGQSLKLTTHALLAIGRKELIIESTVRNRYGVTDPQHPHIEFFGLQFETMSDLQQLTLHALVQQQLSTELDRVWHVLTFAH